MLEYITVELTECETSKAVTFFPETALKYFVLWERRILEYKTVSFPLICFAKLLSSHICHYYSHYNYY